MSIKIVSILYSQKIWWEIKFGGQQFPPTTTKLKSVSPRIIVASQSKPHTIQYYEKIAVLMYVQ